MRKPTEAGEPASAATPRDPEGDEAPASQPVARLLPEVRTEHLIAIGRLLLGVFGLFAVIVDPPSVLSDERQAALLLSAYSGYALVVVVALRLAHAHVLRHRLAIHILDVSVFAALVIFTGRTESPFFSPVVFPIVAATLRWQELGAIRTGGATILFFAGIHLYDASTGIPVLNTALVRYAFLTATTLLLAEIGHLERKYGTRVMRVARWPHAHATERSVIVREVLARAASAVTAPRAVLAWEDPEEPWTELFAWEREGLSLTRLTYGDDEPFVAAPLRDYPFLWKRARRKDSVLYIAGDRPHLLRVRPLTAALELQLKARTILGLPLRGNHIHGHLFLLDAPDLTADDLRLGEVLARQVTESLEHFVLSEQLTTMKAAEERVRLSRDLHDGVLQTLTGIALQVAAVRQIVNASPALAAEQLQDIEQLILEEQRDLRFFTVELRLRSGQEPDGLLFPQALDGLLTRAQKVWGIRVVSDQREAALVPPKLAWETYQLLREGLVNAARHGHASNVEVHFARVPGVLRVSIADDGAGFPFHGHLDMEALVSEKRGPRSLRERVQALNGDMQIESSPAGAQIAISLPTSEPVT